MYFIFEVVIESSKLLQLFKNRVIPVFPGQGINLQLPAIPAYRAAWMETKLGMAK